MLFCANTFAARHLVMKVVGAYGKNILTNRDVEGSHLVDRALYNEGKFQFVMAGTEEFNSALNRLLIECIVFEEADTFGVAKVTSLEIDQTFSSVKKSIYGNPKAKAVWEKLDFSDSKLKQMVTRKMRANRFIKYKSNSSFVQVSDDEARDYFKKNRLKFGTMEFDNFKSNIKAYLGKKNAEDRLRDWFDILRKKYQVKNLALGDSKSGNLTSSTR